ncbi:MAG: tetratricopeptide repeat protein [bacterium]
MVFLWIFALFLIPLNFSGFPMGLPENLQTSEEIIILLSQGDTSKACSLIYDSLKTDSLNPNYSRLLGQIYFNKKNYKKALDFLRISLKRNPRNPEIYFILGDIWLRKDITDSADFYFSKSRKINPRYEEANIVFPMVKNLFTFKDCLNKSISDKDSRTDKWYFEIANIYHELNLLGLAENYYKLAIAANPENSFAQNNLGSLYGEMNKDSLAIRQYKNILQNSPYDSLAAINIGRLYEQMGLYDSSQIYWKKAFSTFSDNPEALWNYSKFLERHARPPEEILECLSMILTFLDTVENPYKWESLEKQTRESIIYFRGLEADLIQLKEIIKKAIKLSKKQGINGLEKYINKKIHLNNGQKEYNAKNIQSIKYLLRQMEDVDPCLFLKPNNLNLLKNDILAEYARNNSDQNDLIFYKPSTSLIIFRPGKKNFSLIGFMSI